jgi:AraC-like DNA-binding protein
MPIYMDRHDVSDQVTAEIVAQLHQQDLKIQDQFDCKGLTYWFDEKRKTAFCLIEAPNADAIQQMHDQAHGEVPHQIIEVDTQVVESFLGRIVDPEKSQNTDLNIIRDPAFRAIMVTGYDEGPLTRRDSDFPDCLKSLSGVFARFDGQLVKQNETRFLVSFPSVSEAVRCAIDLHTVDQEWQEKTRCDAKKLKTGIGAGVPVTEGKQFFEEAIQIAERMFHISDGKIVMSLEIKKLYKSDNLDAFIDEDLVEILNPSNERFLNRLMSYMAETWQNPDLHIDDFGKHLGCSKSQLYRKMITLTGMSPNNFIKEYRLNQALSLINQQSGNISEIAYETGFNSPSYFAKCFHKKFGLSPSEYLNQVV